MPTEKPRITFALDKETLQRVEDYKFKNRAKNQSQAVISLIEKGLESLQAELKEKTPAPVSAEAKETVEKESIPLNETDAILAELGYIRPGEQLSDADYAFLEHLGGLLNAWFGRKDS